MNEQRELENTFLAGDAPLVDIKYIEIPFNDVFNKDSWFANYE